MKQKGFNLGEIGIVSQFETVPSGNEVTGAAQVFFQLLEVNVQDNLSNTCL